jgi:DNA-binding PadR family transcriptional regulator
MAALSDVLLVLLADRPGTSHQLQGRHIEALGPDARVDITRIAWTLARQERLGLVRTTAASAQAKQRVYALTEAGSRRQRMWLLRLPADAGPDDIRTRVLLAVEATDRDTFETVVAVCLAHLELSRLPGDPDGREPALTSQVARTELADASLAAQLDWLRRLRARPRKRD